MKILYCIQSTYNSGGMERILSIKANYLCEKLGYEVFIVTTDQMERPNFYNFSNKITFIDLSVNYYELSNQPLYKKVFLLLSKQKEHYRKLKQLLCQLNVDIAISMFGRETPLLWRIKDNSRKIIELHFSKYVRLQREQNPLWKIISLFNTWLDRINAYKYDKFIVLTNEDLQDWNKSKKTDSIIAIPNPTLFSSNNKARLENKRVIAVGRLSYQKGFDMLILAWKYIQDKATGWSLDIYGEGDLEEQLNQQIKNYNLCDSVTINKPSKNIQQVYLESSVLAFSSRYEGLPLVLIEAMSCGLPVVSFACKCGPKDIIKNGYNGFLIPENNVRDFADALLSLIDNEDLRKDMGKNAFLSIKEYGLESIMNKWDTLFRTLI